jgi:hypothetical protein
MSPDEREAIYRTALAQLRERWPQFSEDDLTRAFCLPLTTKRDMAFLKSIHISPE